MAYYSYYQNSQPNWGTNQYQYVAPPMPQYQPQPSWHGGDYYRAHSNNSDNTLFDYVWSKVRTLVGGHAVGRDESIHWWKRVYGGLVKPSKLLPREIGAAAGYEAIRCWEHHKSIYVQPLSEDREREREALIGLATAEATKLWAYTQRPRDKYGRMEASEVAAATASRIFGQSYDYDSSYDPYGRSPRARRRSISGMRYDAGSGFPDEEYMDDDVNLGSHSGYLDAYPRRNRNRRLGLGRRSSSLYRRSPSPVLFERRSPSPVMLGTMGMDPSVGLSSAAYPPQYASGAATGLGPGIPGTYYPQATGTSPGYYPQSTGTYPSYASPYAGGTSPYTNRSYAGSSVGLPPPPTGNYLTTPGYTHRRTHSAGAYGAVRPTFAYPTF